jgi:hypothetical protein
MAETKKKIGTVISHMRKYNTDNSNHGYVVVCRPTKRIVNESDTEKQINVKIQIPDWCPLDDYNGENKTYDILNQE